MKATCESKDLSNLIRSFFRENMLQQRNLSPQTIKSYRDVFRLFFQYARQVMKKSPSDLKMDDFNASLILNFLDYLEGSRKNSVRTRNARLAAIRSFVKYASLRNPEYLPFVQEILAVPMKRFDRPLVGFLSKEEVNAVIESPDPSTWSGHRDQVMFTLLYNTGARVSEMTGLKINDVFLNGENCVRFQGKGRKERMVPLWKSSVRQLAAWFKKIDTKPTSPVFPNRNGTPLTRSGVENRLRAACRKAKMRCPSLKNKNVSPHSFRHTTAMHMLQSGVDITTIALWLGHESPSTTHMYVESDMKMKERALEKLNEPSGKPMRFIATDPILAFLDTL